MSFWGTLGKVALKAAPIAAGFIPGVGPLASMAIGAGTAGLGKKLEGGSLKDSLLSGAIGGATGYASGKLGDMTTSKPGGIGPSDPSSYVKNDILGVANKVAGAAGKASTASKIVKTALGLSPLLGLLGSGKGGGSNLPQPGGMVDSTGFGGFGVRNPDVGAALERGKQRAIGLGPRLTPRYSGAY